jgi:hypothetical protein
MVIVNTTVHETQIKQPLTNRGVLLSTLLHAILNTFPQFAECIIKDCR